MDKIEKFLKKIPPSDSKKITFAIFLLFHGQEKGLNITKLKGEVNVYHLRVNKYRIFFKKETKGNTIIDIRLREENTYKNL